MTTAIVTFILIGITVLISNRAYKDYNLKQQLLFHPYTIGKKGEYWRFLTHGFIHADSNHLFRNMLALFLFGMVLEKGVFGYHQSGNAPGIAIYIFFYLSAIIVASIPSYFKHQNNSSYGALGASGATSALVFAYILATDPWNWFLFPPLPAIIIAVGFIWYSTQMDKKGADNIAHDVHIWGAIYGLVFMLAIDNIYDMGILDSFIEKLLKGPRLPQW